jgi:hypothetical protein
MEQKTLRNYLIALAIVIITIFLFAKGHKKNTPAQAPQEINPPQEEETIHRTIEITHPAAYDNVPSITIVRKPASQPRIIPPAEEENAPRTLTVSGLSEVPGITKTGPYPTETERKEMKSRNIVLY